MSVNKIQWRFLDDGNACSTYYLSNRVTINSCSRVEPGAIVYLVTNTLDLRRNIITYTGQRTHTCLCVSIQLRPHALSLVPTLSTPFLLLCLSFSVPLFLLCSHHSSYVLPNVRRSAKQVYRSPPRDIQRNPEYASDRQIWPVEI